MSNAKTDYRCGSRVKGHLFALIDYALFSLKPDIGDVRTARGLLEDMHVYLCNLPMDDIDKEERRQNQKRDQLEAEGLMLNYYDPPETFEEKENQ